MHPDQSLFLLLNHHLPSPLLDKPLAIASSFDFWLPFLALAALLFLFAGPRSRLFLLYTALSLLLVDAFATNGFKKLLQRPRPEAALDGVRQLDLAPARPRFLALAQPLRIRYSVARIAPRRGGSFPSGHAANNFCVVTVALVVYRRWWVALGYLPAAIVAFSRIYVGSHWPSDVLFAIPLSLGLTLLLLALLHPLTPQLLNFLEKPSLRRGRALSKPLIPSAPSP